MAIPTIQTTPIDTGTGDAIAAPDADGVQTLTDAAGDFLHPMDDGRITLPVPGSSITNMTGRSGGLGAWPAKLWRDRTILLRMISGSAGRLMKCTIFASFSSVGASSMVAWRMRKKGAA